MSDEKPEALLLLAFAASITLKSSASAEKKFVMICVDGERGRGEDGERGRRRAGGGEPGEGGGAGGGEPAEGMQEEAPKKKLTCGPHTSVSIGREATGVFWAIQKYGGL